MGILLVCDVTDEASFSNIRNWMKNIEQHASDNVVKVLVGNKCDMDESKRAVPYSRGQVSQRRVRHGLGHGLLDMYLGDRSQAMVACRDATYEP